MPSSSAYEIQFADSHSNLRRSRVGLIHQRTGVPAFLLYLESVDQASFCTLHSIDDVELAKEQCASLEDQEAWDMLKPFFWAEGSTAEVIQVPICRAEGSLLSQMTGENKGVDYRTGIHALRSIQRLADLIVVPQASVLLQGKDHQRYYEALFELVEDVEEFFVLVDFPKDLSEDKLRVQSRRYHSADAAAFYPWLYREGRYSPPAVVAAAAIQRTDAQIGIGELAANRPIRGGFLPLRRVEAEGVHCGEEKRINSFCLLPNAELIFWGGMTLGDSLRLEERSISTRRTISALRNALYGVCEPFVLEPLATDLPEVVAVTVDSFFEEVRSVLHPDVAKPFETEVRVDRRKGEDVLMVNVKLQLPYVLEGVTLTMDLSA